MLRTLVPGCAASAIGVMPDPLPKDAPVARVTMTKAAILSARSVIVAITGTSGTLAPLASEMMRMVLRR